MCGIFGIITSESHPAWIERAVDRLFKLSESRGKEAAGVALLTPDAIRIYKEDTSASEMISRTAYRNLYRDAFSNGPATSTNGSAVAVIGHSRLVTTGGQNIADNNQPVISGHVGGIHNGIVVNHEALWRRIPDIQRRAEVDSEVICGLIRQLLGEGRTLVDAVRETFRDIQGAASVALLFGELDQVVLATNNGSLYTAFDRDRSTFVFASERAILQKWLTERSVRLHFGNASVRHLRAGEGCVIDLSTAAPTYFSLFDSADVAAALRPAASPRNLVEVTAENGRAGRSSLASGRDEAPACGEGKAPTDLRRCTRCILPETMPYIEFDAKGVCNYCRNYKKLVHYGVDALEQALSPLRRSNGECDCLVGISGGRDSCYGLHYIKTVLKMNPVAYTYDWGMVTDLARRNISRLCGKLGVEHILVSADIARKRSYIRHNVKAWLARPDLGMIPLFMAGDKMYFHHANRLKRELGLPVILLCENMLERTDFKSGFSRIRPKRVDEDHVYTLHLADKARILGYYLGQYLRNPRYLNSSVPDTMFAYACYYWIKRDYLNLFRFIEWDERTIVETLRQEYDWELADDTKSSWRIGDGTASFYNYIYYTVAGFSENDTFRSNQIREGKLIRNEALAFAAGENKPRWKSIRWYCDIIGVDFESAISTINRMPRLGPAEPQPRRSAT
ncbi:MAG TPA: hypothetical protein VMV81_06550 [Phycisphaerae bacterium]|nr:hypothetical protein [Phycisphaerae bacterium]